MSQLLKTILTGVIISVIGGVLVWYITQGLEGNSNPSSPNPSVPEGGGTKKMIVTATATPNIVTPNQLSTISVYVQDDQGNGLSDATVTLSTGGGKFNRTSTSTTSGYATSAGTFADVWSCSPCGSGYVGTVRVTKSGYEEAKQNWEIHIQ